MKRIVFHFLILCGLLPLSLDSNADQSSSLNIQDTSSQEAPQENIDRENTEEDITNNRCTYKYLDHEAGKYYLTPQGKKISDRRRTGPLHPTVFDLARADVPGGQYYVQNEPKCDLQEMFRTTIYRSYGFDIRRYLNALYEANAPDRFITPVPPCSQLNSPSERSFCEQYQQNPACTESNVTPVVFLALSLPDNGNYLTLDKQEPFDCNAARRALESHKYVPKNSVQWSKIERDLKEDKKKEFLKNLKANIPHQEIKEKVLADNPQATKRDIDFATQEYLWSKTDAFNPEIEDAQIQAIVEKRYAPFGVIDNLNVFSKEYEFSCNRMSKRHSIKMYGESTNIPPHLILLFNDYVDQNNQCICHF